MKWFAYFYFTNLLEVHPGPGPCICACFNPRSTRPWIFYIFILHLLARSFSGSVGEAAFPSIRLHLPSSEVVICPFFFKQGIPTPFIFACTGFSAVSYLYNILRSPIRSWGSFFVSNIFRGGSMVVGDFFLIDHWVLHSCLRVAGRLTVCLENLQLYLDCNSVPFYERGSKVFDYDCSATSW